MTSPQRPSPEGADQARRVTTFELFFDLVFVFAFTQVSRFMAEAHSASGVGQALIILGVLWWSWVAYGWLGNQTFVDEGPIRVGMAIAMAAMFIVALVIPESFVDLPGGLYGPMVFVAAYVAARLVHLLLYLYAAGSDRLLRRQVLVTVMVMAAGSGFLVVGALWGGPAQTWLWLTGLTVDVALTYATSHGGNWRLPSASHWTERYGLIVILALGESIVAIGVGVAREPISIPILVGAIFAVALSVTLWWLYFDVIAIAAEQRLARLEGRARVTAAMDGYTCLHFVIIAGVIISALGVEEAMHAVGGGEAFGFFGAWALFGGTSLYLAGHGAFWRRIGGTWKTWRMLGAALLLALVPVAAGLTSMGALVLVVVVVAAVTVVETSLHTESRRRIRASAHSEKPGSL